MKTINTLFLKIIALLMITAASDAHAYMPVIARDTINGVAFEYLTGAYTQPRIILQPSQLSTFLTGVACASSDEFAQAQVEFSKWVKNPTFTTVLMYVKYENNDRDGEYYLATYKKKGGLIDAVLLGISFDIRKIACGDYLFPQMGYYHITDKGLGTLNIENDSVKVCRKFTTTYGVDKDSYTHIEEGEMTTTYYVDGSGKIKAKTVKSALRANKNVIDEATGKMKITKHNDFSTLGAGLELIEIYSKPSSYELTPAEMQRLENELEKLDASPCMKDCETANVNFKKQKEIIERWQKCLIYQNPQKWLTWFYNNRSGSLHMLKRNLNADDTFDKLISAVIDKVKTKTKRLWLKKHIK